MTTELVKKSVLIIGGARSGKSRYAQEIASSMGGEVLFVATAAPGDDEMIQRIAEHRRNRPSSWRTLEIILDAGRQISTNIENFNIVIIDCLTLLVSNFYCRYEIDVADRFVEAEIDGIIDCIGKSPASFIIVSNEVGEGIVPDSKLSRRYRDSLGKANQKLAAALDEVYFMVAGIPLRVKG